jgi:hypothetical protein
LFELNIPSLILFEDPKIKSCAPESVLPVPAIKECAPAILFSFLDFIPVLS